MPKWQAIPLLSQSSCSCLGEVHLAALHSGSLLKIAVPYSYKHAEYCKRSGNDMCCIPAIKAPSGLKVFEQWAEASVMLTWREAVSVYFGCEAFLEVL